MSEELNNTDSTNFTSKDTENLFTFNPYIKSKNEKNEFKEPDHEIKWIDFIQNNYHLKQDIERVYIIIKNYDFLSLISNQGHYPCIFLKGQDTYKVGNQFKGNFSGIRPFIAKVNKSVNLPDLKKIEWLFNTLDNKYYLLRIELFKVTEDNSTVVLKTVKFEDKKLYEELKEKLQEKNKINIFKNIEKILEQEPINLLKYESGIIPGKMEDIWDLVLDFDKFSKIAPNNNYLPNIDIKSLKIGEKAETSIYDKNGFRKFDITLKCKEDKPGWNKWLIVCEASGGYQKKIPKHTILFQLTKINDYECQLSLLTKFHEPIDNDEFKEISNRKKYLLLSIKDFFENFYCPNSSNEL
jgi:hypothetical protein